MNYDYSYCHSMFFVMFQKKMSSRVRMNHDSDEEVDLEALRLAALRSRKPKYPRVNHNNLIPIVPVAETPDFINAKVKVEKVSPVREVKDENKTEKKIENEKASNISEFPLENDQDILSMDDKEEEDSLERLMDQLEAEITGKAPTPTNKSSEAKTENLKTSKKNDKDGFDDEIELVQVKTGKEPNAIIEIRESASPELPENKQERKKSFSPKSRSSYRRSTSKIRSRSRTRSPFYREKIYRRSRSPYSKSPFRSRSPYRRSRSPYRSYRWSRSKSRSPFRRYRSPIRKRSPYSRFSRSRSKSYSRRSPWSLSPRRRSKSPFYYDGLPPRPKINSPERPRRSFSPRKTRKSPRRRSRSPRRYRRNPSPYRSKSPFRRSRSPYRKLSPPKRRSLSPKSKSPVRKYGSFAKSPRRIKVNKNPNTNASPIPRRNHSPITMEDKPKPDTNEKPDKSEKLPEDNEDALSINLEGNLWDESEESEEERESRFKSNETKKPQPGTNNRIVLSIRNLRDGDATNKRSNLNKPLSDQYQRDRFRRDKYGPNVRGRRNDRNDRNERNDRIDRNDRRRRVINERNDENKSKQPNSLNNSTKPTKRSDRKPIVWSLNDESDVKENEVSTTQSEVKENQSKSNEESNKLQKHDSKVHEVDDFDKLISDFEKELESDICLSTKDLNPVKVDQSDVKNSKISLNKDLSDSTIKKPVSRIVKISEAVANSIDKSLESKTTSQLLDGPEAEEKKSLQINSGPEDYLEDDDFVLDAPSSRKQKNLDEEEEEEGEDEDNQSDLRAVLSRRRNERLTKAVSIQNKLPTRLLQSAFQGLGNKKSNRQVQDLAELSSVDKTSKAERRRVLVLHREKNPISQKNNVPEVKPDTTIHQRFTRSNLQRKRRLHRQLDSAEDVDQEDEEPEGFGIEEEKHTRRFRLKRNVTLSSQSYIENTDTGLPGATGAGAGPFFRQRVIHNFSSDFSSVLLAPFH